MYEKGEYVMYGNRGVCKVEKVGPLEMDGIDSDRLFYTLKPVYIRDDRLFTPVDNDKVEIRPILSKEEALLLIDQVDDMETINFRDNAKRDDAFRKILRAGKPGDLIRMIKTLYKRGRRRMADGKKITVGDEKFLKQAEEHLLGEMAVALDMEINEVRDYIFEKSER